MGDGHLGKCKSCAIQDSAKRELENRKNPEWLKKERERCRLKQKLRRALGVFEKKNPEVYKKWSKENRHKRNAQLKAKRAQDAGLIIKKDRCEMCGEVKSTEKHHPDYSKPLQVQWLCKSCHGKTWRKDK
jgi:hypothetical protein